MMTLFGTDGIRGRANTHPMTAETALKTGRAVVRFFQKTSPGAPPPTFVIGRDTRLSGQMLESALTAGILSMGGDVLRAGVFPTPGVAFLVRHLGSAAGIVISASHNPFADNGIKLFNTEGCKLTETAEAEMEQLILDPDNSRFCNGLQDIGRHRRIQDADGLYLHFLKKTLHQAADLSGLTIALDASHGALSHLAPTLFESLGATVHTMGAAPDGRNINAGCGSQHPQKMAQLAKANGADLGVAFDGDGDRVIAADEKGTVLTGDQLIAIAAAHWQAHNRLRPPTVVTTVMSNLGLAECLRRLHIQHLTAQVGDRHVARLMRESGAVIGGEDSGHIIFADFHTTGDGLLAALQLIEIMRTSGKKLSALADIMTVYPQSLVNVDVARKPDLETVPTVKTAIESIQNRLADTGRVLVRYSGTQPMCRVMVEAPTQEAAQSAANEIAAEIRRAVG